MKTKLPRKKKCKVCRLTFQPERQMQPCCSIKCAIDKVQIDKSVKFIQQLESELGGNTSLLDRMNVAYRKNVHTNGEVGQGEIISRPISELKNLFKSPEGRTGITVFNNLVNTKAALEQNWEVPLEKSWQYEKFV